MFLHHREVISTVNTHSYPTDNTDMVTQPDGLSSRDCVVVMSPDAMATSDGGGVPPATLLLSPPPYTEVDELGGGKPTVAFFSTQLQAS